jgi:hypothetical protein
MNNIFVDKTLDSSFNKHDYLKVIFKSKKVSICWLGEEGGEGRNNNKKNSSLFLLCNNM